MKERGGSQEKANSKGAMGRKKYGHQESQVVGRDWATDHIVRARASGKEGKDGELGQQNLAEQRGRDEQRGLKAEQKRQRDGTEGSKELENVQWGARDRESKPTQEMQGNTEGTGGTRAL